MNILREITGGKQRILLKMSVLLITFILLIAGVLAYRLWQLAQQPSDYRAYWNDRSRQTMGPDALTYVALGDSAAQGVGASCPQNGYVGLLADAIRQTTGKPVQVRNLSNSGAKVHDVLERQLNEFKKLDLSPDSVVTLEIGSNNMPDFSTEQFERQLDQVLAELPARTVVAEIPYFGGRSRAPEKDGRVAAANEIIHRLAHRYGMAVAPLHDYTKDKQSLRLYAADFFHPSDYGYRVWFRAFWAVLAERFSAGK